MPYATQQDLEKHSSAAALVQLTDRADPPAGVADQDVIGQALESASSFIDGYLRGRYSVPLAAAPAEIRDACVKLAYKELHTGGSYPEGVQKDYDATIAWLASVSKGVVQLSVDAAPAPTQVSDSVDYAGPERTFNRDTLKAF
jgi:phage gp36-like protein